MSIEKIEFPIVDWSVRYYSRNTPTTPPGKEDRDTYVPDPNSYLAKIDMRSDTPLEGPEGNWRALAYFYPESIPTEDGCATPISLPSARLGIPEHFGEGRILPPPRALRMPSSCRRDTTRESSRLAMLAQPISNTRPTVPRST